VLPRVIRLPKNVAQGPNDFIFLSSILHMHVGELFSGMNVLGCYQFRVTRNSDLFVEEEEMKDLKQALQGELPQRHFGDAVRLEVADNMSEAMTRFLLTQFGLQGYDLYAVAGPVNLHRLMSIPEQVNRPDLEYPPFTPGLPKALIKGRGHLRHRAQGRRAVASSVPVLRPGDRVHPRGGARSPGGRHQADGISHRHRLGDHADAHRRGARRQGGHRRRGADGALRRGGQHQLGRAPRRRSERTSCTASSATRPTPR
jgi:hypothetical protein